MTLYCYSMVGNTFMLQHNNIRISESAVTKLRREHAVSATDFSSPTNRYKMSKHQIVVDDFDREPFEDTATNCTRPRNI